MKKFSIIALILMTIFTFGCSKKDTSDNMVKLAISKLRIF